MTALSSMTPALDAATAPSGSSAGAAGEGNSGAGDAGTATALNDTSISSPHELTDWVDSVLNQLESRFTTMSGQVENRMKEMLERIDALESSIEDLIVGSTAPVGSVSSSSRLEGRESEGSVSGGSAGPQVRISETGSTS